MEHRNQRGNTKHANKSILLSSRYTGSNNVSTSTSRQLNRLTERLKVATNNLRRETERIRTPTRCEEMLPISIDMHISRDE